MQEWYVLHTKPRAEFKTRDALQAQEVTVFLPVVTTHPFNKPSQPRPFFPRYLFAQLDWARTAPDILNWTPGLLRVVSFGGTPARISQEAVDLIRHQLDELEGRGGLPAHDFRPGEQVRIRSGPLQGLYAIFEGPLTPSQRVTLLVDFLGRANRVEAPVEDLESVRPMPVEKRGRRTRGHGRKIRGA